MITVSFLLRYCLNLLNVNGLIINTLTIIAIFPRFVKGEPYNFFAKDGAKAVDIFVHLCYNIS